MMNTIQNIVKLHYKYIPLSESQFQIFSLQQAKSKDHKYFLTIFLKLKNT